MPIEDSLTHPGQTRYVPAPKPKRVPAKMRTRFKDHLRKEQYTLLEFVFFFLICGTFAVVGSIMAVLAAIVFAIDGFPVITIIEAVILAGMWSAYKVWREVKKPS